MKTTEQIKALERALGRAGLVAQLGITDRHYRRIRTDLYLKGPIFQLIQVLYDKHCAKKGKGQRGGSANPI